MVHSESLGILPFEASYQEAVVSLVEQILVREYAVRENLSGENDLQDVGRAYAPPDSRFLLAIRGDELVGTAGVRRISDTDCELRRLYVLASHRRQGIASALVGQLLPFARARGYRRMLLEVSDEMRDTVDRYHRYGFVPVEDTSTLPRPGEFMALKLPP